MKNIRINEKVLETVSLRPYKYLSPSIHFCTYFVTVLLSFQVAMLCVTQSYASLIILSCSCGASILGEVIDLYIKRSTSWFNIFSALNRGIIIGLLTPQEYSPLIVFIVVAVILLSVRYALGGFASSWINPVVCSICVLWILGTQDFPVLSIPSEHLVNRNPAITLIQNGMIPFIQADSFITNFLNKRIFSFFGVSIPDGYISLLWDTHSSIPAFRFNIITLVSSILLISFDVLSPLIPFMYLFVYGFTVRLFGTFFAGGALWQGDIILAFMTSGVLFCTFFILQWNGTVPSTNYGKLAYAVIAGMFSFVIIGIGLSSTGFIFLILLMNVIAPVIQAFEYSYQKRFTEKVLLKQVQTVKDGEHV